MEQDLINLSEDSAGKIIPVSIEKEMKSAYIDYAMSVIVGRALPDVRDGLKPVHRRILYTMYEAGLLPSKPYRKSATTVGDVLGKYHPHGDQSVYDAMVRMAQTFSLRYPLIDGQGNFGSVDGDPPAAYRYTEARMSKMAVDMLTDIEKDTVGMMPSFDEKNKEPVVLPSKFPNLLVNGSNGIAVGMATSIPPHNLNEVIAAIDCILDNPECTLLDLMEHLKGPDFPTAGIIMGRSGIRAAYATGRAKIKVRARAEIEEVKGRFRINVTELPYQVNKARLIESIADLVKEKRIEGISDLRDESDIHGMSMIIELKRDANPQVVLNNLFSMTQMEDTQSIILLALVNNQPKVMSIREMLDHYIDFQREVIVKRTQFDLKKASARMHIVEGLRRALDIIDEIISLIRASKNTAAAKEGLITAYGFSEIQADEIVNMRLSRLTGLAREELDAEFASLEAAIADFNDILSRPERVTEIFRTELHAIGKKYGDERKTEISAVENDIDIEDLIEEQDCVYTYTHFGYIKRQLQESYKAQRRGGRGVSGMKTREEDFAEKIFTGTTHDYVLFFTDKGRVFRVKGYEIAESGKNAKGTNVVNLIPLEAEEKVYTMMTIKDFSADSYLFFVTKNGTVKRTALEEYKNVRKTGLLAIGLDEGDELVSVLLTNGRDNIMLGTKDGMMIRFSEEDVRPMGRTAHGVRGMKLREGDAVVGAGLDRDGTSVLTVTEKGSGKRTDVSEYRMQSRGGLGITNYKLNDKTGKVSGFKVVTGEEDMILIASNGIIIRTDVGSISVIGRATSGVRIMKLTDEDAKLVGIATVEKEPEEEILIESEEAATEVTSENAAE